MAGASPNKEGSHCCSLSPAPPVSSASTCCGSYPSAAIVCACCCAGRLAAPIAAASAVIGDLARPRNMAAALEGVDAVIHSAGLAHAMSGIPEDDYRVINTEATIGLARAARRAGARRFIFLSSIRAQCGPTADAVMTEAIEPAPTDAYGKSKLAAERGLAELDIDWVALRATLVYGPGVKGNMAQLMRLARSPLPLPIGDLARAPLAPRRGKSGGGNRNHPRRAGHAAPRLHRRRPAGADGRGNDCRHAPRTGAPDRTFFPFPQRCSGSCFAPPAARKSTGGSPVRSSPIPRP